MKRHKKTPDAGQGVEGLSDEISETSDISLTDRIDRYSSARFRAVEMVDHLADRHQSLMLTKEYRALRDCGNYLLFRHYFTVDKYRLAALHSCRKHLLCPLCAIRRGAKAMKAYLDRLAVIQADRPALKPYLVTFAIANGEDLDERFRHLTASLRKLLERRKNTRKGRALHTEMAKIEGAVWTFEVSNIGNGWHPHVHMIALCESEPDQQALRDEWEEITGDSWTVDVSRDDDQDDVAMFAEAFKYAMKFGALSLDDNLHAYRILRGKRMVASLGCFRGVHVPDEMTDEQLDELPFVEILYRWYRSTGYSVASVSEPKLGNLLSDCESCQATEA